MNKRQLGDTKIEIGEIGLGAWQIGGGSWGTVDKNEALRMVERSLELGSNFIDTAPGYGGGKSEELVGEALKGKRAQAILCTKFGHHADGSADYSIEKLRSSLEGSLTRLRTDYVDILLMHNPPSEMLDGMVAPHYDLLEQLKAEGKIRAYGVSVDWRSDLETVLMTTSSKAIEVLFNAFHQDPLPAFDRAAKQGVGLIVKVPLDSGWLSGKYDSSSTFSDVRRRWNMEQVERRAGLVDNFRALLPVGTNMKDAALQYILAQPEVSTIIPGARSVEQIEQNCQASEARLPPEVVNAIAKLWDHEIKNNPLPW
jgi:aryl-alcohol dehydrogenase-like predicted oxidoreductase